MKENKRIEKEKKFWDKLSTKYDQFIEKNWKIYASTLVNKISEEIDSSHTILEVACGTGEDRMPILYIVAERRN